MIILWVVGPYCKQTFTGMETQLLDNYLCMPCVGFQLVAFICCPHYSVSNMCLGRTTEPMAYVLRLHTTSHVLIPPEGLDTTCRAAIITIAWTNVHKSRSG